MRGLEYMVDIPTKKEAVSQPDPIKDFTTELPVIDKIIIEECVILIPKHLSREAFEKRIDPVLHAYFNVKEFIPKGQKAVEKRSDLYG